MTEVRPLTLRAISISGSERRFEPGSQGEYGDRSAVQLDAAAVGATECAYRQ
jgi:hypothetical protein